jgi:glycosyl transferase family 25
MVEPVEIIVISLVRSTERRAQAARQLNATGLPWYFLDAVDGSKLSSLPPEYDGQKHIRYYGCPIPVGQIGCFLSHRQAWEKCVETNRLTVIFEDDFQLLQSLPAVIALAQQHVASFDVLKIQGLKHDCPCRLVKTLAGGEKLVQHHRDPLGATGYIVKPSAAKVLLEKSQRFHAPVDDFIFHDWIHGLEIISLLPYPVVTGNYQSNINHLNVAPLSGSRKFMVRLNRLPRSTRKWFYRSKKSLSRSWQKMFPKQVAN